MSANSRIGLSATFEASINAFHNTGLCACFCYDSYMY